MIKVFFKTPQTFLANKEQGGCFTGIMLLCQKVINQGEYTCIEWHNVKCHVLTKSIEHVKPTDL